MALRAATEPSYTFRLGDLPKLDLQVDRGTDFKAWKSQWAAYFSLSGLDKQPATKQVQALTLCFSRETVTIVDNLGLTDAHRASVDHIIAAIEAYVQGQINETVERRNFRRRAQQEGETFDDFLVSLRELAKTCNFCNQACTNKNLRDQIVQGLVDGDTVEELLKERTLTLDTTIAKCRASEAAKRQRAEITNQTHPTVQALRRSHPERTTEQNKQTCPGCGSGFHPGGRKHCPAYQVTCRTCNRTGHFAKVCKSRKPTGTPLDPPTEASAKAVSILLRHTKSLASLDPSVTPAPTIQAHFSSLNGSAKLTALPDSGADLSVAGPSFVTALGDHKSNLLPSRVAPRTVSGHKISPLGKMPVTISVGSNTYKDDIHIYTQVDGILLSWRACIGLGILPPHYPQPAIRMVQTSQAAVQPKRVTSQDLINEFPMVFNEVVQAMEGESFRIELTDDAKPFCVKTPRSIPFAYRDKLKAELETLQSQGIITPVTHPTEWCAPIVVTPKKDSDNIRMCVDLSHLNRYVRRERYHSATPAQAVADITAERAQVFTKIDAKKGYHQCPLHKQSQDLTTFITPFGRFKFLRAPYGISSISEHYNRRMDEAFADLPRYRRVVDDIVIYDQDRQCHTEHVRQFLKRCKEKRITLNTSKWAFAQPSVTFAGFHISAEGYQIDPSITQAIAKFPPPSNRTDLRSFVGLVNQLSSSTSALATLMAPLRPLLCTKNEFIWSEEFEQTFNNIKKTLTVAPTLNYFNYTKQTRLCTDASRQGLGFILQQRNKNDDTWTLIQAGSRFLSDAESRYAIIELELLAVSWAINKCHIFLAGLPHFSVITDHYPLIPILNNHRLDEIENPRLQRLKTKLMGYNFTAEWLKGALNNAPDALSRNPVADPTPQDILGETELDNTPAVSTAEVRAVSNTEAETLRIHNLKQIAAEDSTYQQLKHYIVNGFPTHRRQLPDGCKGYWGARTHLTIEDDLILYGCRLLIPLQMRHQILHQLHDSHQGTLRTKERARLAVYWPGINNDIENIISSCKECQDGLPSNPKEPIIHKPRPMRPFQEIATDFCSHAGQQYLINVDCHTDWPDIIPMGQNTTAYHLTKALRGCFCRTGVPDKLWSDQGPQFTSKPFHDFMQQWGIEHITSSPRYPQSNGKAEATVKSMKKLIKSAWNGRIVDDDKLTRALLQYRNTPSRKDGLSPAQKLYGHPIQDTLPAHRKAFLLEWQRPVAEAEQQAITTQETVEQSYNQHARPLPLITIGSHVAVQNHETKQWDIYGTITDIGPHRRYFIKTCGGNVLVRNRRFIRRRVPLVPTSSTPHQAPVPPRRSSRSHTRPKRLIEEINMQLPSHNDLESPGGGDVGN